jgi:hypothetical protein
VRLRLRLRLRLRVGVTVGVRIRVGHTCVKPSSRPPTARKPSKALTLSSERVAEWPSTAVPPLLSGCHAAGASSDAAYSCRLTSPSALDVRRSWRDGACESTS